MTMNSFHAGLNLNFIQATLEEVITQANSMGDHNIDIPMIEQALVLLSECHQHFNEVDGYIEVAKQKAYGDRDNRKLFKDRND